MHPNFHINKIMIRKKKERMLTRKIPKRIFLPRNFFTLMKIVKAHMMIRKIWIHILTLVIKYLWLLYISQLVNQIVVKNMSQE